MPSSAPRPCRPWPAATSTPRPRYVAEHLSPGDAVLVMGAGKSYQIAQGLKAALEAGVLTQSRSLADR